MPRRLLALSFALLVPAALPATAAAGTPAKVPVVKSVSPLKANIGDTLTVKGANFVPGTGKNTVIFRKDGDKAVFVKAGASTRTQLKVVLPPKLAAYLINVNNQAAPTRFRLRVIGARLSARYTLASGSPVIGPAPLAEGPGVTPPVGGSSATDCDGDGTPNVSDTGDTDADLLPDNLETQLKTDPCKVDSDGDGVEDGYEYYSALDLNGRVLSGMLVDPAALPYPAKRPYANPLDGSDANVDFDGDGLVLLQEYQAWIRFGGHRLPLLYSDGKQHSIDPATGVDSVLGDDVKDVDQDGLGNMTEANGRFSSRAWWSTWYTEEVLYSVEYAGLDWLDQDTDGDGVPDGADDIDHDGFTNADEASRAVYWTQPFNPCLPNPGSPTCSTSFLSPAGIWPPFDETTEQKYIPLFPAFAPNLPPAPLPCPVPRYHHCAPKDAGP